MRKFNDAMRHIVRQVNSKGGAIVGMTDLKEAAEIVKLGSNNVGNISKLLEMHGISHIPDPLPTRQDKVALLFLREGAVEDMLKGHFGSLERSSMYPVDVTRIESATLDLMKEISVGNIVDGKVVYFPKDKYNPDKHVGAKVELLNGRTGMCHISQVDDRFVQDISEFLEMGENYKFIVTKIEEDGRLQLSRKEYIRRYGN